MWAGDSEGRMSEQNKEKWQDYTFKKYVLVNLYRIFVVS